MEKHPFFFLADDDEDDQLLFREAMRAVDPLITCVMVKNGREALQILQGDLLALPDFIFLDLNMPVMNGLECLEALKRDEKFARTPIIIYSTFVSPQLSETVKQSGGHSIFKKPDDYQGLLQYIKGLLEGFAEREPIG